MPHCVEFHSIVVAILWYSFCSVSPFAPFYKIHQISKLFRYQFIIQCRCTGSKWTRARARAHRFIFTQVGQSILLSWVGVKNMSQDRKQCGWGVIEFVRVYIVYVEFYFIRYNNWHEIRRTLICIWLAVICDWNRLQYHVLYQWKDNLSLYPRIASNCFDLITLELNYVYVLPLACECVLRHLLIRDSCL